MNIDYGAIVTQLLVVLLPILVVALIGWASAKAAQAWQVFKSKFPKWASLLDAYAPEVVAAAEQLRKTGVLPTPAAAKEYAVTNLQNILDAHGAKTVNVGIIANSVEAAVSQLPAFSGVTPTPTPTAPVAQG